MKAWVMVLVIKVVGCGLIDIFVFGIEVYFFWKFLFTSFPFLMHSINLEITTLS